jgi:hypothetical protein
MSKKKREKKLRDRIKALSKKKKKQKPPSQPAMPFPGGMPFMGRSPFDESKAPKGFRPIPMMQAVLEFAGPVMKFVEDGTVKDPNDALQIGQEIWNYTLPKVPPQAKKSRSEIVEQIRTTLQMNSKEAEEFFDHMVERKDYLFPEEVQPEGPAMTMFMRKEVEYLITKFDESQLEMSEEPIPPDRDDQKLLNALHRMDEYIEEGADYDEWEAHFFKMQEICCDRYYYWLKAKGIPDEYSDQFPFCVEIYLNFIYQYDEGDLQDVSLGALEEFFMDFLMRKVMMQPPEYTQWPPALRLFYTFLAEKGYLDDPESMIELFDDIEPDFIALIKERS